MAQFEVLIHELEQYQEGLSSRPRAILANKIDDENALQNQNSFNEYARKNKIPVFFVSGKMGFNLKDVLIFVKDLCDRQKQEKSGVESEKYL